MKIRFNEDKEIVAAVKEGLKRSGGYCPCRMVAPVVAEIAEEHPEYAVGKINVDDEPELAQQFGVVSIPLLVVMRGGEIKAQAVGVRPKSDLLAMLEG